MKHSSTSISRSARIIIRLKSYADKPWFLFAVIVFPLLDYILPFLPNQIIVLVLSAVIPQKWWQLASGFALATGLGAVLTSAAIQAALLPFMVSALEESEYLQTIQMWISTYGLLALIPLSMLPWPPRTAVIACGLAGLNPVLIGVYVAIGRTVPAFAYAFLGMRSPHLLQRFPRVKTILHEIEHSQTIKDPIP